MVKNKLMITLLTITLLLTTSSNALAYIDIYADSEKNSVPFQAVPENKIYEVKKGDTLWGISQNYKIEVEEIMKINNLKSNLLLVGQKLVLPHLTNSDTSYRSSQLRYNVQKGDSLWVIAERNNVLVSEIISENNLQTNILQIGQILLLPSKSKRSNLASQVTTTSSLKNSLNKTALRPAGMEKSSFSYTDEEYEMLAKLIEAEAENQPFQGKVAVGSVVMNRIKDDWFPDTIEEVIFQKSNRLYQFSPVGNGRFNRVSPSDDSYQAAKAALGGEDPTDGALYFYNPDIATDRWIRTRTVVKEIGQHSFAN
jgi:N-acetylmuramoyl-L-alanine amidase